MKRRTLAPSTLPVGISESASGGSRADDSASALPRLAIAIPTRNATLGELISFAAIAGAGVIVTRLRIEGGESVDELARLAERTVEIVVTAGEVAIAIELAPEARIAAREATAGELVADGELASAGNMAEPIDMRGGEIDPALAPLAGVIRDLLAIPGDDVRPELIAEAGGIEEREAIAGEDATAAPIAASGANEGLPERDVALAVDGETASSGRMLERELITGEETIASVDSLAGTIGEREAMLGEVAEPDP